MMIDFIARAFQNFTVKGVQIPVVYAYYFGHGEPYVVFTESDQDNVFAGDDDQEMFVGYYDFDVYAKSDYLEIFEKLKTELKTLGFVYQPSRSSGMMYETDTRYYHRTYNFAYIVQANNEYNEVTI